MRLAAERPGILNRLLDGWRDYREKGLDIPDSIIAATEQYRIESDPIGQFLEQRVEEVVGASLQAATLYQAYVKWSHANGLFTVSNTKFGTSLVDRGYAKDKQGGYVVYQGVRLRDLADQEGSASDQPARAPAGSEAGA
jgi:putative DNA primase/helicase